QLSSSRFLKMENRPMSRHEMEILLVEDNPSDAELTLRALSKNKIANSIVWVKDGAEALDFIFAEGNYSNRNILERPKVVFLDLKLPKMDGIQVLEKIRADERTKTIPVVVLTSSKEECDIIETYKLGVNSYVVKPVDFDKFVEAVAQLGFYWLILNQPPTDKK